MDVFPFQTIGVAGVLLVSATFASAANAQARPDKKATVTPVQLRDIVAAIVSEFDTLDVVCLGEDHGDENDSLLRIAVVEHPDFVRKVDVIIVEFAAVTHQEHLDRFILDGEEMTRAELAPVWSSAHGAEVWDNPIYEAFLRAVHKVNLRRPKGDRVRVIAGDDPRESNRGRFIREAVAREVLDRNLKGLAVYGAGHCECRGGGFPGELVDYRSRIWSVFSFYDADEGRKTFDLGDEPILIRITGSERAKLPAVKMFFTGTGYNDPSTLGDIADAIVYYGR
jgi:hypothetical protein